MEVWKSALRELCGMPTLLWLALQDKRYLGISRLGLCIASGLLLIAGSFGTVGWQSRAGGAAFGAVLLVFCLFSKEALGLADGVLILVCGAAFGLHETVTLCFFAAVYTGGLSAVLLLTKRAGRKSRIPFLPFLLLGYITMRILKIST